MWGSAWAWKGTKVCEGAGVVPGVTCPPLSPSYDDYNYGEVNQLLERSLKVYIKTVACYPEKTTKQTYTQFWRHFKHSEKVLPHPFPPTRGWGDAEPPTP